MKNVVRFIGKVLGVLMFAVLAFTTQAGAQASQYAPPKPEVKIKDAPIKYVSPCDGQKMYAQYCAACHGEMAKGNGPAALVLATPPPDLTMLTAANNGKFPAARLRRYLTEAVAWEPQGRAGMPYWHVPLRSLDWENSPVTDIRISALISHVKKLQIAAVPVRTAVAGK